ncbi:hypothetical protein GQ44DRAFT_564859, partial [Phaeosphaeriaceae sp. PMI808]
MALKLLALAMAVVTYASPLESPNKADNNDPCQPCQPKGATGTAPPAIGPDLSTLYTNVLGSVKDIHFKARSSELSVKSRESGFCCRASLNCVNVQNLNIPMCYDKFTTNFAFADNSFGSLTTGEYQSGGNKANLFSGNYSAGNIYAAKPQDKPNTSTLSIPPQYTGTGVGSAVPPNQLGSVVVYTTTISGTTFTAPTTLPQTVKVVTVSGVAVSTTEAPRTITQATTIAEQTTVVTATNQVAASSSKAAGVRVDMDQTRPVGMGMLSALMYAL